MKFIKINEGFDQILNVKYKLVSMSAKELSGYLKGELKANKIKYEQFNTDNGSSDIDEKNPPKEIYEYQNFFLLQKPEGEYVLLDGFRRLLWYTPPHVDILVRVYQQHTLSDRQILSLLVNLNHFKFYGGGDYHDRGFGLLLRVIFGLNINKYREAMDGYLVQDKVRNDYGSDEDAAPDTLKSRITNKFFVDDMRFLEELCDSNNCMVNEYVGSLLYISREEHPETKFLAKDFIKFQNQNPVMKDLMVKFKKEGTNRGAKSREVVNRIMEIYENIFKLMVGGKVEKSYAELLQESKDLVAELRKDKGWTKVTGNKSCYYINKAIAERLNKKVDLQFKCVVAPVEDTNWRKGEGIQIPSGLLQHKIKFLGMEKSRIYGGRDVMRFGFKVKDTELTLCNAFGSKKEYSSIYGWGEKSGQTRYDVETFVNIPEAEWKALVPVR